MFHITIEISCTMEVYLAGTAANQELKHGLEWQFIVDGEKLEQIYHLYFQIIVGG